MKTRCAVGRRRAGEFCRSQAAARFYTAALSAHARWRRSLARLRSLAFARLSFCPLLARSRSPLNWRAAKRGFLLFHISTRLFAAP